MDLDFGQIASGRVLAEDGSGRARATKDHAAGEIVGLRPSQPNVAEIRTKDGQYFVIAVNR